METLQQNKTSFAVDPVGSNLLTGCLRAVMIEGTIVRDGASHVIDVSSLTAAMARADESAFRAFHDLYFDRLLRYLLVLTRNEASAREALQLTFLRVVRNAKRFESEEAFWSWLTVLARSSVVDEQRKKQRYTFFLSRFFQQKESERSYPSEADGHSQTLELLEQNLALLSSEDRLLIEKKYFAEASVRDIAEELHSTEKAVESRLVRVRRKLRELILTQLKHGR